MYGNRLTSEDFLQKLGHPLNEQKEQILQLMKELGLGYRIDVNMPYKQFMEQLEKNPWLPSHLKLLQKKPLESKSVIIERVSTEEIDVLAAYGGFTKRWPSWRWYQEWLKLSTSSEYGLHKIYEMIISNEPLYAYFGPYPEYIDKTVLAHAIAGHGDFFHANINFFAHNRYFRNAIDMMANHALKIIRFMEMFGEDQVQTFLSACFTVEMLFDRTKIQDPFEDTLLEKRIGDEKEPYAGLLVEKLPEYMRDFVNSEEFKKEQAEKYRKKIEREKEVRHKLSYPEKPEADILLFLKEFAPTLEEWQRDILDIIRKEMYYFAPIMETNIMNEGWAATIESKFMAGSENPKICPFATIKEIIDYADMHSGVLVWRQGSINPYAIGKALFRNIEKRYGWEECLRARCIYNDVQFFAKYFDQEFCDEEELFVFSGKGGYRPPTIDSRKVEEIRDVLLFELTNFGRPKIVIKEANYNNRGELFLIHENEPPYSHQVHVDLARAACRVIAEHIWKKDVHFRYKDTKGVTFEI